MQDLKVVTLPTPGRLLLLLLPLLLLTTSTIIVTVAVTITVTITITVTDAVTMIVTTIRFSNTIIITIAVAVTVTILTITVIVTAIISFPGKFVSAWALKRWTESSPTIAVYSCLFAWVANCQSSRLIVNVFPCSVAIQGTAQFPFPNCRITSTR